MTSYQHGNNNLSDLRMEVDAEGSFYDESISLPQNQNHIAVELVDVGLEECPEGPFPSESSYSLEPFLEVNFPDQRNESQHGKPSSHGNLN